MELAKTKEEIPYTTKQKPIADNLFESLNHNLSIDDLHIPQTQKDNITKLLTQEDIKKLEISFPELLELIWFSWDVKNIFDFEIESDVKWIYVIKLESSEFEQLTVHIELINNLIKRDRCLINKNYIWKWLWVKNVLSMIHMAKDKWFKSIYWIAVKAIWLDKKYKSRWYHFFPKLWFLFSDYEGIEKKFLKKIKKSTDIRIKNCKSLNELFALKDEEWNYIWLEYWKKIWDSIIVEFDLEEWSESNKRLNDFINNTFQ